MPVPRVLPLGTVACQFIRELLGNPEVRISRKRVKDEHNARVYFDDGQGHFADFTRKGEASPWQVYAHGKGFR